jgi:hypothetical protein
VAVDLALIGCDDQGLRDVAWTLGPTAQPHDAPTWYRLPSGPGIGKIWRVGRRDAIPAMRRFPRVQAGVS